MCVQIRSHLLFKVGGYVTMPLWWGLCGGGASRSEIVDICIAFQSQFHNRYTLSNWLQFSTLIRALLNDWHMVFYMPVFLQLLQNICDNCLLCTVMWQHNHTLELKETWKQHQVSGIFHKTNNILQLQGPQALLDIQLSLFSCCVSCLNEDNNWMLNETHTYTLYSLTDQDIRNTCKIWFKARAQQLTQPYIKLKYDNCQYSKSFAWWSVV